MKSRSLAAGLAVVLTAGLLTASAEAAPAAPKRRVIVMLSDDARSVPKGKRLKLVNAVATSLSESEIEATRKQPGVKAVVPDTPVKAHTDVSVPLIGATEVRERYDATGKGVVVAVIDSGVDYTHPDLQGRVVGGYDFVNNDADPMDDNGHGTHVAGIIAGKAAAPGGITGVAPEASIMAYKVMNEWGEGWTSDIIAGIEAAADPANPHRADVINLSLGGPGDGTDPLSQAANAAARSGVVVIASAGNSGPGRDTVGSPAAAEEVIAVGASTTNLRLPSAYLDGHLVQTYRGAHSANPSPTAIMADVVDVGYGSPEDWARAGDVTGKIVRVETYVPPVKTYLSTWDIELAREAENRGAIALLGGFPGFAGGPVVAADGPTIKASGDLLVMDKLVVMGMDSTQFDELTDRLAAGRVQITIRGEDATDRIADFSSRGPSATFGLKPDIVAPGVEIRSTVPQALFAPGQYRMSGTSMAAPHVAGAAALLRQLTPGQSSTEITARLVGSAKPLTGTNMRLDVKAAVAATLTATPATLSFGLADLSKRDIGGTKTLTLRSSNATTVKLTTGNKDVRVKPDTVSIPANGTATVTVTIDARNPEADTTIEGLITATPSQGTAIHIPYLLVVRPLVVQTSPDPSDGTSTAYIFSYATLAAPPTVTVRSRHGRPTTVTATLLYGNWYSAALTGSVGTHQVSVRATAATGQILTGESGFEVTPQDTRRTRWEPVGPYSEGGELTLSPTAPQQGVMTQYGKAGPWLTTDNGQSWSQLNRLPIAGAAGLGTVVVDASRSERWWYAVNDPMTGQGKVLRTNDRGKTWESLPLPATWIKTLVADELTRVLVAVTTNGLLVSNDGGDSWTASPSGVDGEVTHAAIGGDDLYLGTWDGVWVRRGISGPSTKIYDSAGKFVNGVVANGGVVAALVSQVGVVGSHDGGQSWSTLYSLGWGGFWLDMSGTDISLYSFMGTNYIGRDNGRTWSAVPVPVGAAVFTDYDRWADGSMSMSAESAGLYKGDGTSLRRTGVQGGTVYDLAICGGTLLAGTDTGVYRTSLPIAGPDWGDSGGEGMIGVAVNQLEVSPSDPNVVWRVRRSAFGSFYVDRSSDAGLTWEERGVSGEVPIDLAIHPSDPDRVTISFWSLNGTGLFTTTNGGGTWKNLFHNEPIAVVAGDPASPQRWWLGTASGLYRSDDGGVTKQKVADGPVSALLVSPGAVIAGGDTIRVSTNGFKAGDVGDLSVKISDLIRVGDTLYAATTSQSPNGVMKGGRGVLRSTDGGRSWHSVSNGLQNLDATRLATDGTWLYVGTIDGGVHRIAVST